MDNGRASIIAEFNCLCNNKQAMPNSISSVTLLSPFVFDVTSPISITNQVFKADEVPVLDSFTIVVQVIL